jgi:hypothetical protein
MLSNPWVDLPAEPPFVLPCDADYVREFNMGLADDPVIAEDHPHYLDTSILPTPIGGRRDSPVLHLQANPLRPAKQDVVTEPALLALVRGNLGDDPSTHVNIGFVTEFAAKQPGRWWLPKYAKLIRRCGLPAVAANVTTVEFHGYNSYRFATLPVTIPSQHWGFEVVRRAMANGAVIIVGRAATPWFMAVPGLRTYCRLVRLSNPQQAAVSPGNCRRGETDFELIVSAIGAHSR